MSDQTPKFAENTITCPSGYKMLATELAAAVVVFLTFFGGIAIAQSNSTVVAPLGGIMAILAVLAGIAVFICLFGFFVVNPNEGRALLLFGDYKGTVRTPGLFFTNPFYTKKSVSLRVRNFESQKLKVNDKEGNPIEIAAVVVWNVVDTAEALFHVDDYENFVHVQSESAVRNLATHYAYDAHVDGELSLRSNTTEIAEKLQGEIQERLRQAGVRVIEARISHLAYAPEIAGAMLQRQQASAIIAARQKIVEGAVGMVEMALDMLAHKQIVELSKEKKADMVGDLLVVLCGERAPQPILSTGSG